MIADVYGRNAGALGGAAFCARRACDGSAAGRNLAARRGESRRTACALPRDFGRAQERAHAASRGGWLSACYAPRMPRLCAEAHGGTGQEAVDASIRNAIHHRVQAADHKAGDRAHTRRARRTRSAEALGNGARRRGRQKARDRTPDSLWNDRRVSQMLRPQRAQRPARPPCLGRSGGRR